MAFHSSAAETRPDVGFEDPASLAAELRKLQHSLDQQSAPGIRAGLPSAWRVRKPRGREYSISTAPLRLLLDRSSFAAHLDPAIVEAQTWLDHLATQLEGYSGEVSRASDSRARLQRILARQEFAGDAPPNAWDRFRSRVVAWVVRWIERLLNFSREHSTSGRILFWLALVGALGLLGFWLVRLRRRDWFQLGLSGTPTPTSVQSWERWLHAARASAQEGDLRKAIQCAYWAGVTRLQDSGALPSDGTRTPREYLRLLSAPEQRDPTASAGVIPLGTLTSYLERFWYARATASPNDFSICLGTLEALGCKVD